MANLNIVVTHGQSENQARVNFEKAISEASSRHRIWIRKVEWSDDRTSATLSGPRFQVTLSVDAENVYAKGQVPLALKLLEGPVRRFVEQSLTQGC
jgi:hypothetical protein